MNHTGLPSDTRIVALLSAIAFLLGVPALSSYPDTYFADVSLTYVQWLFAVVGSLQMLPFLVKEGMLLLKTIMFLAAGSVWLWMSFASIPKLGSYPMLTIGLASLYSFVIDAILIMRK